MKKVIALFLGCAVVAFCAAIVLWLWIKFDPPDDIFTEITMSGCAVVVAGAGIVSLALAGAVATGRHYYRKFRRSQGRCSRTAEPFVIEHLP